MDITTQDVLELRAEAGAAGDVEMAAVCTRALGGDDTAWTECGQIIEANRAAE